MEFKGHLYYYINYITNPKDDAYDKNKSGNFVLFNNHV